MRRISESRCCIFSIYILVIMVTATLVSSLRISPPLVDTYASLGSRLWWTCSAVDSVPPSALSIVWRFGNVDLTSDIRRTVYSNGSMYIPVVQSDHLGEYTCVVRDSQTSAEARAWLRLAYISQSAVIQPLVQSVRLGDAAVLECRVDAQPSATFDWTVEGATVTPTSDLKITQVSAGVSTLRISEVKYQNAGRYACAVSHVTLASPLSSMASVLNVYGPPQLGAAADNQDITLPLGYTATFECPVVSEPAGQVSWGFQTPSLSSPIALSPTLVGVDINTTTGTLTLENLLETSSGSYICTWTNQYGQVSTRAHLTVQGLPESPQLVVKPSDITANEGDTVIMNCSGTGNPLPEIKWLKRVGGLEINTELELIGSKENDSITSLEINEDVISVPLVIDNVSKAELGTYTCKIINEEGQTNASAYLEVMFAPFFNNQPQSTTVRESESLTLFCSASGNPQPSISWTLPDNSIHEYNERQTDGQNIQVLENGQLIIRYVTRENNGIFTCSAMNSVGATTVSVTVSISGAPHFLARPTSLGVIENDQVELTCTVSASPSATVIWYYKYLTDLSVQSSNMAALLASITTPTGELSVSNVTQVDVDQSPRYSLAPDGSSILISVVRQSDAGFYVCHASNIHGSAFALAVLRVITFPKFEVVPQSSRVSIGDSIRLDCYSTGIPVPTQRWLFQERNLVLKPEVTEFANGSLLIENVTEDNLGLYTCLATNQAGQRFVTAILSLSRKPTFTASPQSTTVPLTSSAALLCQGESQLPLQISWYKSSANGELLQLLYSGNVMKSDSSSLLITTSILQYLEFAANGNLIFQCVDKENAGWYSCQLKNDEGTIISAPAYVDVQYIPDSLELNNSPSNHIESQNATIACKARGLPLPSLSWIAPSKTELRAGSTVVQDVSIQPSEVDANGDLISILEIKNLESEAHGGQWMCKACNVEGCRIKTVELDIQGVPHITSVVSENAGNEMAISCLPSGRPAALVMYFSEDNQTRVINFDGHRMESNILYIRKDSLRSSYLCNAENLYGISSSISVSPPSPVTITDAAPMGGGIRLTLSSVTGAVSLTPTELIVQYRIAAGSSQSEWLNYSMPLDDNVDNYILALKDATRNDTVLNCAASNGNAVSRKNRALDDQPEAPNHASVSVTPTGSTFVYQFETVLARLEANTVYDVRAMLLNMLGSGPPSLVTKVRTLSSAPSIVTNAQVAVNDLTITVTWNNPHPLNGQPNDVIITVLLLNASISPNILLEETNVSVSAESRATFTVLDLGQYSVQLTAYNTKTGDGGETATITFSVQQVVPSFVPRIEQILVMTPSSLEIHWSSVEQSEEVRHYNSSLAKVTGYRLRIERLSGDLSSEPNRSIEIEITNRSTSFHTADGLLEHEEYSFSVAATNDAGRGVYSKPVTATTLYQAFSEKALDEEIPDIGIRWRLLAIILIVGFSLLILVIAIILFSIQAKLSKCKSVDLTPPQSSRNRSIEEDWMEIEEEKHDEAAKVENSVAENNVNKRKLEGKDKVQTRRATKEEPNTKEDYDASNIVLEGYPNDSFAMY